MNQPEQQRRDDSTDSSPEQPAGQPANGQVMSEKAIDEPVDQPIDESYDYESDEPADDGVEPVRRSVVTMRRGVFISMVALGAIAILALGASTLWLTLDRRGDSDDPVVATVNGEEIRRSEYDTAVAQSAGADVLENLILERLITSEARKRSITADGAQVTSQIDEIKQQAGSDQAFQSLLQQQGFTEESLTRQFEISTLLRQMVADQVQVSDDEVNSQYQANAQQYQGQPEADAKQQIRQNLEEQKANSAARDFLGQLRDAADVQTYLPGKSNGRS